MAQNGKVGAHCSLHPVQDALTYAVALIAIYSILFVNISGSGSLWDSVCGVMADHGDDQSGSLITMRELKAKRDDDDLAKAQKRELLIPEPPEPSEHVRVLANEPFALARNVVRRPVSKRRAVARR